MIDLTKILRVRCPHDGTVEGSHLAVDVRLPLSVEMTAKLLTTFPHCQCGASMLLKYDNTPTIGSEP